MLRTLLIATALLSASGASYAREGYYGTGRVVTVEPHVVISFGTPYPDGFRVLYESSGARYWTHAPYYPGPRIVLRPDYRGHRMHHFRDRGRGWGNRHDWKDRQDDWHEDRRDHRHHDND
jgi:hypothetical protein